MAIVSSLTPVSPIFQLTFLFVLFFVISGYVHFGIERAIGNRFSFSENVLFTRPLADEMLIFELMLLPIIIESVSCIAAVRIFRLRQVSNEIAETLPPIILVATGYGRFLLVAISVIYFFADQTTNGLVHLTLGVVAYTWFYFNAQARKCLAADPLSQDDRNH